MLFFMGHSKVHGYHLQKHWLWQRDTQAAEIASHIKRQTVAAFSQTRVIQQHTAWIASVNTERDACKQSGKLTIHAVEFDLHASGRTTMHGV